MSSMACMRLNPVRVFDSQCPVNLMRPCQNWLHDRRCKSDICMAMNGGAACMGTRHTWLGMVLIELATSLTRARILAFRIVWRASRSLAWSLQRSLSSDSSAETSSPFCKQANISQDLAQSLMQVIRSSSPAQATLLLAAWKQCECVTCPLTRPRCIQMRGNHVRMQLTSNIPLSAISV